MMIKPSVFYLSVMVFTMLVYLTAFEKWGVHLSFAGFGITLLGFAIFAAGERIGISFSTNLLKAMNLNNGKKAKLVNFIYPLIENGCGFLSSWQ